VSAKVEVLEDPARACSALMVSAAIGGGEIVLTGGSTPRAAYESFVEVVEAVGVDLSPTRFWVGDERCVGPEDENSNYRMIKESLLDPLSSDSEPTIERMKGELGPEAGAEDYEQRLRAAGTPRFDLLLLGIGPDGHTASLFPGKPATTERDRLVVGVPEAGLEPFVPRISMTVPVLVHARQVVVMAAGESKAEAVARAFGPGVQGDPHVPASLVAAEADELIVLADPAAASQLSGRGARG
jgi:6-phosphogluconolactonase